MNKKDIREKVNGLRKSLSQEEIDEKSKVIVEKLMALDEYKNAKTIMSYVSLYMEVNTQKFIKDEFTNKNIVVPVIHDANIQVSKLKKFEFSEGKFGVLEPLDKEAHQGKIDVVIVPGVAFDPKGRRIGFGKGYYDKFLKNFDGLKIAFAFDEQIVDDVPTDEHDVGMDMIITDKRIIRCQKLNM